MRHQTLQKPLAALVSLSLVLGLMPAQALAEGLAEAAENVAPEISQSEVAAQQDEGAENDADSVSSESVETDAINAAVGEVQEVTTPVEETSLQPQEVIDSADVDFDLVNAGDRIRWTDEAAHVIYEFEALTVDREGRAGTASLVGLWPQPVIEDGKEEQDYYGTFDVEIPSVIENFTILKLEFNESLYVRSYVIPSSVIEINAYSEPSAHYGPGTFGNSRYLREVTFEQGTQISSLPVGFFMGSGIEHIDLPENMTTIESDLFNGSLRLTSVTIPQSVTSIGDYAFYNTSLSEITLPDGVKTIGSHAFGKGNKDSANWGTWIFADDALEWADDVFDKSTILFSSIVIPDSGLRW